MTIKAPRSSSIPDLYYGKYVSSLFSDGEQGVWYDPSDLGTLFQDAAGTTPVTAVEQPVGLMLDKSKNGVGRNGTRRVNLLTYSERFNTGWTYASGAPENTVVSIIPNASLSPIETATASKIVEVAATSKNRIYKSVSITSGTLYTFSISLKSAGRRYASIRLSSGANQYGRLIDLDTGLTYTGRWDGSATTNNLSNVSVVDEGNGWLRLTGTFLSASTSLGIFVQLAASTNTTLYTGDGVSGIYVWGADLRLASEANTQPTYQRIDADWPSTIPGNHATQTTTASRPTLSARVNLLQKTEQFDDAAWVKTKTSVSANSAVAPDGTTAADTFIPSAGTVFGLSSGAYFNSLSVFNQSISVAATTYKYRLRVKSAGYDMAQLRVAEGDLLYGTNQAQTLVSLSNGAVNSQLGTGNLTNVTGACTRTDDGWCDITLTFSSGAAQTLYFGVWAWNSTAVTSDGIKGLHIWGADLRVANESPTLPSYQRVNTATDYDTQGFPLYLRFDGVDDSLVTPSINFASTDKMTVFVGVRKLSDAAYGYIVSLDGTSGNFAIFGPGFGYSNTQNYGFNLYGTSNAYGALVSYASPISNVLTASYDISRNTTAQEISVRVNQLAQLLTSSGGPAGTGNFGSWPLIIGRPRSWQLPFNGRLYGLIVRGAQTDDLHLTNVERYLANKSGVVL